MRTTLNLDAEVLAKVRILAKQRGVSIGTVVSELVRKALHPKKASEVRNGVPLFPPSNGPAPDLEIVNKLRD
jgi:hypothetical protein